MHRNALCDLSILQDVNAKLLTVSLSLNCVLPQFDSLRRFVGETVSEALVCAVRYIIQKRKLLRRMQAFGVDSIFSYLSPAWEISAFPT